MPFSKDMMITGGFFYMYEHVSMCRLLRLLGLLQQLFVLSLIAPQRVLPLVGKPLPTWLAYLVPLLYLVAVFINFMACLWSPFLPAVACCVHTHDWLSVEKSGLFHFVAYVAT